MRKAGLDESPVGIKIAGRNINNLRYADDITLTAESEEELKSLLMWVKEECAKVGLKLNIKQTKIMASGPLTSWQIDGEEMEDSHGYIVSFIGIPWNLPCSIIVSIIISEVPIAHLQTPVVFPCSVASARKRRCPSNGQRCSRAAVSSKAPLEGAAGEGEEGGWRCREMLKKAERLPGQSQASFSICCSFLFLGFSTWLSRLRI
ncbi:putative uncharacterized transposon-derived protein F52C9.6 [Varanus komodoensis]|nr:putative uncharacterized transposon-derived protein F52C9.6 [Varanus komodoensis]